jgi:polysaccharide deacetylase family protein (PEP-CTERM system associated)
MFDSFSVDWEDYYPYPVKDFEKFYSPEFKGYLIPMTHNLLEIFEKLNIKTTFFCIGHFAKQHPDLVKQIKNAGHEIASHTYSHRFLNQITTELAKEDIYKSISVLEDITGEKVKSFRAPAFSLDKNSKELLSYLLELGIEYDSSFTSSKNEYGGNINNFHLPHIIKIDGQELVELPVSVYKKGKISLCYSGGGYFRSYPKSFIINNIRHLKEKELPFIGYIHPRDIYKDQKIIINYKDLKRTAKSYIGLKSCKNKFEDTLRILNIVPINELGSFIRNNK